MRLRVDRGTRARMLVSCLCCAHLPRAESESARLASSCENLMCRSLRHALAASCRVHCASAPSSGTRPEATSMVF